MRPIHRYKRTRSATILLWRAFVGVNLLTVLVFFSAQNANAQFSDYVVTTKGDTIKCTVEKGGSRYKAANMKHYKYFDFDEISAYYSTETGAWYRAIVKPYENDEDTVFARVVENGKITLYKVQEQQPSSSTFNSIPQYKTVDIWYISKSPGHIETIKFDAWGNIPVNKRNTALAEMIKDNKEVYGEYLSRDKTTIDLIQELIHEYNTGDH